MRLNKYIAHSGLCSRRKAGDMVKEGKVKLNGEVYTNPAYLVQEHDVVEVNEQVITPLKSYVYFLLNKPKDVISTVDDPYNRKTVVDFVKRENIEKIFPVGRLDRNTTGLILLTNDGDLTKKLTHPSHEISKVYEVELVRSMEEKDLEFLRKGFELEDGFIQPDAAHFADHRGKNWVSIKLHSGRNRIVRRMIAHLGYEVKALDRIFIAGLTKKGLKRGWYRKLTGEEVRRLKYFGTL